MKVETLLYALIGFAIGYILVPIIIVGASFFIHIN